MTNPVEIILPVEDPNANPVIDPIIDPIIDPANPTPNPDEPIVDETVIEIDDVKYTLDKEGNAVNSEGKVFKTKAELSELENTINDSIIIDDITYKIDKAGHAIDDKGNIFKTKEEIDSLLNPSSSSNGELKIDDIISRTNFKPVDEQGNPIVYENSYEGIAQYTIDTAKQYGTELYNKATNSYFEANPDILAAIKYKRLYGSLDGFKNKVDYSNVEIGADNIDQQKNLVLQARMLKGDSKEEAERFIKYSSDEGKLIDDANSAKQYLIAKEESERKIVDAKLEEKRNLAKQKEIDFWSNVKSKILVDNKLKVGEQEIVLPKIIQIPDGKGKFLNKTNEDFYNYMYAQLPVQQGENTVYLSQYEIDTRNAAANRQIDDDILEAYTMFTKGNKAQLIEKQVRQQKINEIKKLKVRSINTTGRIDNGDNKITKRIVLPV